MRSASTCHRAGEVAPMALLTYQDARPYARAIKEKVASRQMPPWFADKSAGTFANDPSLTDAEIATITRWVDAGAPQGDSRTCRRRRPSRKAGSWASRIRSSSCPRSRFRRRGGDYFPTPSITPDLKEDRWIRAIEIRPGNRQITHHSVIFSASIDMMRQTGTFDVLGVWAVGTPATVYPEGSGRWIRKGQMLRTNLHYHPNGTAQTDRTRIGLYFGKGELKKEVVAGLAGNLLFTIPAERRQSRTARRLRRRSGHRHRLVLSAHASARPRHDDDRDVSRRETGDAAERAGVRLQLAAVLLPEDAGGAAARHPPRPRRALRQLGGEQEQSGPDETGPVRRSIHRAK